MQNKQSSIVTHKKCSVILKQVYKAEHHKPSVHYKIEVKLNMKKIFKTYKHVFILSQSLCIKKLDYFE